MRAWIVLALALTAFGCDRKDEQAVGFESGGTYSPGEMWAQVVRDTAPMAGKASPEDDEQIIVVIDRATGEVRQCGNYSGACIGMNPWEHPLTPTQSAPVGVNRNKAQLREDEKREAKAADTK